MAEQIQKIEWDFGDGLREYEVVEAERCVYISISPFLRRFDFYYSEGASFDLLARIERQKFLEMRKAWKKQFGSGWLGYLEITRENAVQRLREAMDFWEERGFAVVTCDIEDAEAVAKFTKRRAVAVAFRKKDGDFERVYQIKRC